MEAKGYQIYYYIRDLGKNGDYIQNIIILD